MYDFTNPAGYPNEDDVILDKVDILNWNDKGHLTFRPRLRDIAQQNGGIEIDEDLEWDCD